MKLIASAAMKKVDTKAIGEMGIPEAVLIENAGRAVADGAADLLGEVREKKIILLIGKGNNGGDGLAAATIARCDYTACIPMSHGVDSLNVAAASAVAFWQLRVRPAGFP